MAEPYRWEYAVIEETGRGITHHQMNDKGGRGWELVSESVWREQDTTRHRAVFKRPK